MKPSLAFLCPRWLHHYTMCPRNGLEVLVREGQIDPVTLAQEGEISDGGTWVGSWRMNTKPSIRLTKWGGQCRQGTRTRRARRARGGQGWIRVNHPEKCMFTEGLLAWGRCGQLCGLGKLLWYQCGEWLGGGDISCRRLIYKVCLPHPSCVWGKPHITMLPASSCWGKHFSNRCLSFPVGSS